MQKTKSWNLGNPKLVKMSVCCLTADYFFGCSHILMTTISFLLWWVWISGYTLVEGTSISLFLRPESETPGTWISGKFSLGHYWTILPPSRLYKDVHGSYWYQCTCTCLSLWLLPDNCDPGLYGSPLSGGFTAPESCQGSGILGKTGYLMPRAQHRSTSHQPSLSHYAFLASFSHSLYCWSLSSWKYNSSSLELPKAL